MCGCGNGNTGFLRIVGFTFICGLNEDTWLPPVRCISANFATIFGVERGGRGDLKGIESEIWLELVDLTISSDSCSGSCSVSIRFNFDASGFDLVFFFRVHWFCLANRSAAVLMSGDSGPPVGDVAASARDGWVGVSSSELLRLLDEADFLLASCADKGRSITKSGVCFWRISRNSWEARKILWLGGAGGFNCVCDVARLCQSSRFAENVGCSWGSSSWEIVLLVWREFAVCCTVSPMLWDFQCCFLLVPRFDPPSRLIKEIRSASSLVSSLRCCNDSLKSDIFSFSPLLLIITGVVSARWSETKICFSFSGVDTFATRDAHSWK